MKLQLQKIIFVSLMTLGIGTGCVMTPTGDIVTAPVGVEAEVDLFPRVHVGSRSAVTIWLHPDYYVYDAYPIAQRHCGRWGLFARPRYDWSVSAGAARYLDYRCVRHRPYLAYPHFRRGYHPHPRRRGRVYTPKPLPRVEPVRRRGTFGRTRPDSSSNGRVVERGKPWEHNARKRKIYTSPRRNSTVIERGKSWEHNVNKNKGVIVKKKKTIYTVPPKKIPSRRGTFGSFKRKTVKAVTEKSIKSPVKPGFSKFTKLKSKKEPKKRKSLRL